MPPPLRRGTRRAGGSPQRDWLLAARPPESSCTERLGSSIPDHRRLRGRKPLSPTRALAVLPYKWLYQAGTGTRVRSGVEMSQRGCRARCAITAASITSSTSTSTSRYEQVTGASAVDAGSSGRRSRVVPSRGRRRSRPPRSSDQCRTATPSAGSPGGTAEASYRGTCRGDLVARALAREIAVAGQRIDRPPRRGVSVGRGALERARADGNPVQPRVGVGARGGHLGREQIVRASDRGGS